MGKITHTAVRRTEAEIAELTASTLGEHGFEFFPMFEVPGVGVEKYARALESWKFRQYNSLWNRLDLPSSAGQTEQTGASAVTPRILWDDWTVEEVISHFCENGTIDLLKRQQTAFAEGEPWLAGWDVAHSVYTVAKGWVAEQQVNERVDWLAKMGESHDVGGIDFQFVGEGADPQNPSYRQLRPLSWGVWESNPDVTARGVPVLYYGWVNGELILGDDAYEVRQEVSKGIPVDDFSRNYEYLF